MTEAAHASELCTCLPEPAAAEIRLAAVLHALAEPIRLRIVCDLAAGHQEMACIAFSLPVSKSTTTHHFRVLREAGVIRQYRRGTARMSTLRQSELDALFPGLLTSVLGGAHAEEAREPGELGGPTVTGTELTGTELTGTEPTGTELTGAELTGAPTMG